MSIGCRKVLDEGEREHELLIAWRCYLILSILSLTVSSLPLPSSSLISRFILVVLVDEKATDRDTWRFIVLPIAGDGVIRKSEAVRFEFNSSQ